MVDSPTQRLRTHDRNDGVQLAASHANPRTTMPCDRASVALDRRPTYIVPTVIAGADR